MSSDVHAKWMNSATRAISSTPAKRSRSQYSTALTSWLVVRSIALTRSASAGENDAARRIERGARIRAERRDFGDRRLLGERDEPRDLDAHARADQPELAEVLGERRDLVRVAAVERRQGHQRGCGFRHRGRAASPRTNGGKRRDESSTAAGCRLTAPRRRPYLWAEPTTNVRRDASTAKEPQWTNRKNGAPRLVALVHAGLPAVQLPDPRPVQRARRGPRHTGPVRLHLHGLGAAHRADRPRCAARTTSAGDAGGNAPCCRAG